MSQQTSSQPFSTPPVSLTHQIETFFFIERKKKVIFVEELFHSHFNRLFFLVEINNYNICWRVISSKKCYKLNTHTLNIEGREREKKTCSPNI